MDNSDWWSVNRTSEPDEFQPQEREFASSTFQVLGIDLGEKMFGGVCLLHVCGRSFLGGKRSLHAVKKNIERLTTASGLRLGQTATQVTAILGKPTVQRKNEFVYFFLVRKQASPDDLKEARRLHPEMTDENLRENFGSYDLTASVRAKFAGSKLTYLAVSKVESN